MGDVIKGAKQLLDGATPAPWEWVGYSLEAERSMVLDFQCVTEFGMNGATREVEVTPEDEALIASAPELAQSLAEETWEYSTQAKRGEGWETCTNSETHLEEWWANEDDAEWAAGRLQEQGRETRIVRRRVSPPEVINE